MELISIIIPVYNGEKTLNACVKSVCSQSYKNWELVVVNDGSRDGTGAICDAIAETDSRIRVFHQANSGVSAARNFGMRNAAGEFITFLDADDVIPVNYLEVLHTACQNADISVCDVVSISGGREITRFTMADVVLSQEEALNCLLTRKGINSGPCAKLFRRAVVEGVAFPPLKAYEDIIFVKDVFERAKRVAATNRTEYKYIQNNDGAMSRFSKMPSADIINATKHLLGFIGSRTDLKPETFYVTASHLMQYIYDAADNPNNREFVRQARQMYKIFRREIMNCTAFPWKEKIIYVLFSYGWLYRNKKIRRV